MVALEVTQKRHDRAPALLPMIFHKATDLRLLPAKSFKTLLLHSQEVESKKSKGEGLYRDLNAVRLPFLGNSCRKSRREIADWLFIEKEKEQNAFA